MVLINLLNTDAVMKFETLCHLVQQNKIEF